MDIDVVGNGTAAEEEARGQAGTHEQHRTRRVPMKVGGTVYSCCAEHLSPSGSAPPPCSRITPPEIEGRTMGSLRGRRSPSASRRLWSTSSTLSARVQVCVKVESVSSVRLISSYSQHESPMSCTSTLVPLGKRPDGWQRQTAEKAWQRFGRFKMTSWLGLQIPVSRRSLLFTTCTASHITHLGLDAMHVTPRSLLVDRSSRPSRSKAQTGNAGAKLTT